MTLPERGPPSRPEDTRGLLLRRIELQQDRLHAPHDQRERDEQQREQDPERGEDDVDPVILEPTSDGRVRPVERHEHDAGDERGHGERQVDDGRTGGLRPGNRIRTSTYASRVPRIPLITAVSVAMISVSLIAFHAPNDVSARREIAETVRESAIDDRDDRQHDEEAEVEEGHPSEGPAAEGRARLSPGAIRSGRLSLLVSIVACATLTLIRGPPGRPS